MAVTQRGARAAPLSFEARKGSSPANGAFVNTVLRGPARRSRQAGTGETFETTLPISKESILLPWLGLSAFVVVALYLDIRLGGHRAPSLGAALKWSVIWTALGIAFGAFLLLWRDSSDAGEYLAGFLIEKSLSLDNLFVFAVLFAFFKVPEAERQRVLVLGIAGAIVLRGIFILAGAAALETFSWATYVLGVLLLYTAIRIARTHNEEMDPEGSVAMRALRRVVPLTTEFDGEKLITKRDGKRMATPLAAAFAMVAFFDVMFAIDSIPAIFAVTRDTYIVFAANAFSLLGMISLFFLLDNLLARFRYLNVGVAVVLGFVGAKVLLEDVWHIPVGVSLAVIVLSLGIAALASAVAERREERAAASGVD